MKPKQKKATIDIEIFPLEKSCAQGCPPCPLAKKSNVNTSGNRINSDVQNSFSVIEEALKRDDQKYNLHFASILRKNIDLFPIIHYPQLVHMNRFETDFNVKLPGGAASFSELIGNLLKSKGLNPEKIGFSFVPQHPRTNVDEAYLVKEIIEHIKSWFFNEEKRKIEVTIRSNLIPLDFFKEIVSGMFWHDEQILKPILYHFIDDANKIENNHAKKYSKSFLDNMHLFFNAYTVKNDQKEIEIFNRIIAIEKRKDQFRLNKIQALSAMVISQLTADFALAPKGVMLMHSSAYINNPILWITHEEFQQEIVKSLKNKHFSPHVFLKKMIYENRFMYLVYKKQFKNLHLDEFKKAFECLRPHFRKMLREQKRKK